MAGFAPGSGARILLGDFSLSPKLNDAKHPYTVEMLDTTTFGSAGSKEFIPGIDTSTFTAAGFVDLATFTDQTAWKGQTADTPLTYFPFGDTVGNQADIMNSQQSKLEIGTPVLGVVNFNFDAQTDGATDFGVSLHALGAETANSTGTIHDNTGSSANGAAASLHVTAFSGFTNIAIKITHSATSFTPVDLITFTTVTGVTSQLSTVAGTVNRYTRVEWTVSGSGSCTFAVAFARR